MEKLQRERLAGPKASARLETDAPPLIILHLFQDIRQILARLLKGSFRQSAGHCDHIPQLHTRSPFVFPGGIGIRHADQIKTADEHDEHA